MKNLTRREPPEDVEIQPADPAARARAMWIIAAVVVLGGLLVLALNLREEEINRWMGAFAKRLIDRPEILLFVAFVLMLPLVGVAAYIHHLGSKVVKAGRIPFPGQKVIKDTPIITGKKAVQQGRAMQVMAFVMGIIGVILPFGLVLVVIMLQRGT